MKFSKVILKNRSSEVREGPDNAGTDTLRGERFTLETRDGWVVAVERDGKLRLAFPPTEVRHGVPILEDGQPPERKRK